MRGKYPSVTYVLIRMHDHLRDMGRSVIDNQSQPTRLWRADDIGNYLAQIQHGMVREVRGICGSSWNDGWKRFLKICGDARGPCSSSSSVAAAGALKLLQAEGDSVITEFNYLSRHLIWLRLDDCRDANALSQLRVPNLRVVELFDVDCDLNTLWQGQNQVPTQLRELYIQNKTPRFTKLPKCIGLLEKLEKIVLLNVLMKTLPDELCQLQWLNHLDLSNCLRLESLPSGFGNLINLRHLDLNHCWVLEALPNSFSQLIQLHYLSLLNCRMLMVSMDILRNIETLEYLDFHSMVQETLPAHITNQRLLTNLYVDCHHLKELPVDMGRLCNLRVLEVASETMTELTSSLTSLTSLKSLSLSRCQRLQYVPESIAQLQALEYLNLSETAIQVLPHGVAHLRNLIELNVDYCPLGDIMLCNPRDEERPSCSANPLPVDSLAKAMIRLQSVYLESTETTKLCISTDVCPNLETLEIMDCECLIQVEALPITLVNLKFRRCERLEKVEGLQNLTRLRHFNITGCFELQGVVDLSESRSLEVLKANGCCMITKMQGLQQLQELKEVQISARTAGVWKEIECLKALPSKISTITLNMQTAWQTVGAEEIKVDEILKSFRFPISVLPFESNGVCRVKASEARSFSGVIIIHLCESKGWTIEEPYRFVSIESIVLCMFTEGSKYFRYFEENDSTVRLCSMRSCSEKAWAVVVKDKDEWKMREIWEKLFSYAHSKRAFKDSGVNLKSCFRSFFSKY